MTARIIFFSSMVMLLLAACDQKVAVEKTDPAGGSGLRIAYINGDSVLMNFKEFRTESEAMSAKQKQAEEDLQRKGTSLEREIMAYQQEAQKGTLTGKQMETRERELGRKQEALLAERDRLAKEIMDETSVINERLQKVLQDRLKEIKEKEGYDFILSYIAGGPILIADEKYDITEQVLRELNKETPGTKPDTTKK